LKPMTLSKKPNQFVFILRAMFVTAWLVFLLSFKKLPQLLAYIESKKKNVCVTNVDIEQMIALLNRIAQWKFFLIRKNCLKKNLLFYYYLVQYGVSPMQINIGINKNNNNLDGHCWLTVQDRVFMDTEQAVSKYTIIYFSGV